MKIEKIDNENYRVDGAAVWLTDGVARCIECPGPLVAMSRSCRHARAVMRLTQRAPDGALVCPICGSSDLVTGLCKVHGVRATPRR